MIILRIDFLRRSCTKIPFGLQAIYPKLPAGYQNSPAGSVFSGGAVLSDCIFMGFVGAVFRFFKFFHAVVRSAAKRALSLSRCPSSFRAQAVFERSDTRSQWEWWRAPGPPQEPTTRLIPALSAPAGPRGSF